MEIMHIEIIERYKIKVEECKDVHKIIVDILKRQKRMLKEKFYLWFIGFDGKGYIVCIDVVLIEEIDSTLLDPVDVFSNGIDKKARSCIFVRNAPDGNVLPTETDIDIADRMYQSGRIASGILLEDYMIISMTKFFSFIQSGMIKKIKDSVKYVTPWELERRYAKQLEENREMNIEAGIERGIEIGKSRGIEEGKERGLVLGRKEGREEGLLIGMKSGMDIGVEKGKEIGKREGKRETAKRLKKANIDIKIISKATGFSIEEINKL